MTYPDPVTALQMLGLGRYAAGIFASIALLGFLVAHALPWLPPATAASPAWWRVLYSFMSGFAGNYLHQANKTPPAAPSASAPIQKGS